MTAGRAALAMLVVVIVGAGAHAEGARPRALALRVGPAECTTAPAFTAFVDALQVELAATGPRCCAIEPRGGPASPDTTVLDVDPCDPTAREVDIAVQAGERRRISLADVRPEARPRALALAVAEMVRSASSTPGVAPSLPAAPVPAPVAPSVAPTSWGASIAVQVMARAQPSFDSVLGGGRLAWSFFGRRWGASAGVDVSAGHRAFDLGVIDVRLIQGTIGVGPRFSIGRAIAGVGASAGMGWAWVRGRTSLPDVSADSGAGLVATLGVRGGIEAPAWRAMGFGLEIEVGETLRRFTATVNGVSAAGVSGPYVMIAVGLGFGLRARSP